jgi:hypothetical protein
MPSEFPGDVGAASRPGLYAWSADSESCAQLTSVFDLNIPSLIYAGQTGAGTSKRVLRGRIALHIGGSVNTSTLRESLAAILVEVLPPNVERHLSAWIAQHLRVTIAPCDDRKTLAAVERRVLSHLDPAFNLEGMPDTPVRRKLRTLRSEFRKR